MRSFEVFIFIARDHDLRLLPVDVDPDIKGPLIYGRHCFASHSDHGAAITEADDNVQVRRGPGIYWVTAQSGECLYLVVTPSHEALGCKIVPCHGIRSGPFAALPGATREIFGPRHGHARSQDTRYSVRFPPLGACRPLE